MKNWKRLVWFMNLAALGAGFSLLARAQVTNNEVGPTNSSPASLNETTPLVVHTELPVFHPPGVSGGILPIRVGGGSRGAEDNGVTVEVLVPDEVALTTREQPTLYWFQSKAAKTRCEVALTQPKKAKPLLILRSSGATRAGIHCLKLSDFKVKLTPKVAYKWSVALVIDPANRSQDIVANGVIEYVEPSSELKTKLMAADRSNRAAIYAGAGIWYDALDILSTLIAEEPKNQTLQDERAKLLSQVGLDGARIENTAFAP